MRRHSVTFLIPIALAAVALSACSSGGNVKETAPPPVSTTASASPAPAPNATDDPCEVLTAAEASALAGVTFGPGLEEDTGTADTPGKRCTYGAKTTNVFFVQIASAADASSAAAQWDQERAAVSEELTKPAPPELNLHPTATDVPGLADKATIVSGTASLDVHTFAGTSIALLDGATYLSFGDLTVDAPAPTATAMEAQAKVSLGRLH